MFDDPYLEVRSANETRDVRIRQSLDLPAKCVTAGGMASGSRSQTDLVGVPPDPGVDPPVAASSSEKPPFRLPTMAEIEAARGSTGLRVVSTFSGCGGSCLGLEMAGYDVQYACEFVEAARNTYRLNHAEHVHLDPRDIRAVRADEILEKLGIARGELDVFEGSPPCASFSTAGNRDKDWGKVKKYSDVSQRTDDLFLEWARLLEGLQPRVCIAENVSGLVKGKAYGYFVMILKKLEECGYVVRAQVLDAQWLGVPQQRQRLIFVGIRKDVAETLGITSKTVPFPTPRPYFYSMLDALPHLRRFQSTKHGYFDGYDFDRGDPTLPATKDGAAYNAHVVEADITPTAEELAEANSKVQGYAIDREYAKTKVGKNSEKFFNLARPNPALPIPTVTAIGGQAGTASVVHPFERRKFTIRELRRLCAFPDDFRLTGDYAKQWERLGRSVPPRMMYSVGATLRDEVFARLGLVRPGFTEAP